MCERPGEGLGGDVTWAAARTKVDSRGGIKLLLGGGAEETCDVRPLGGVLECSPVASRWIGVGLQTLWGEKPFYLLLCFIFREDSSQHARLPQSRTLRVFSTCINTCFLMIVFFESGQNTIYLPLFVSLVHRRPIFLATRVCLD